MRVLHVTNIISPHQIPLACQIVNLVGVNNYRFVATEPPMAERVKMGWNADETEPWVLRAGEYDRDRLQFEKWWDKADVVICNERIFSRMNDRLRKEKLTFYMSERWWKPPIGIARMLHPRFALMAKKFINISKSPVLHYLPIGLYAADDMKRIAKFSNRIWNWGYFTELPNLLPESERDDCNFRILWAGRMLGWKRVDTLIRAFARLQNQCKGATLSIVGDGPERIRLENMAKKLLKQGSYSFFSSMPISRVLELMREHNIYVLPSNGYEGWGAVLNEAMSVGCTVIACSAGGAARTMIKDGVNGLLFAEGDWRSLTDHFISLYQSITMCSSLAGHGQQTITQCWSPAIAAERFLAVSEAIFAKRLVPFFDNGPMMQL